MSRSRRKVARFGRNTKGEKRLASKAVRRADVDSGGAYKRVYSAYDICDYKAVILTRQDEQQIIDWFGDQYMRKGYIK